MSRTKGKSLCLFSAKGGVGKTINTINLAGIFASLEKKVLIIDFDMTGGDIAVSLNKSFDKTIYNFVDDYNNNRYKDFKDYITKYDDFIDFLAAPKDPRQASKVDSSYVEIIMDKAIHNYDVVLIDTNHNLNELNISILDKTDEILFLVTNDPMDLKNMKSLLSIFKDIELTNYKLLLNNSRDPFKNYFTLYDIKNILKNNIDYTLSSSFYIKNIDSYIMDGKIVTQDNKMPNVFNKDYAVYMTIATDLFEESKGDK